MFINSWFFCLVSRRKYCRSFKFFWSVPSNKNHHFIFLFIEIRICTLQVYFPSICLQVLMCWITINDHWITLYFADQNVLNCTLEGHTNAVWGLSVHSSKMQLLSCSADGTVRLWSPGQKPPLLQSYTAEEGRCPTLPQYFHYHVLYHHSDVSNCPSFILQMTVRPHQWIS